MKNLRSLFFISSAIFLLMLLNSGNVFANEAQLQIYLAGVNLGHAEARLSLYLHPKVPLDVQRAQEAEVLAALARAATHLGAAEDLFDRPFYRERGVKLRGVLNRIRSYSTATRNSNYRQKAGYVSGIFQMYLQGLRYTFVSSRQDTFQYKSNCDSRILEVGYFCGKATIAAEIDPAWKRTVGAVTYQLGAFDNLEDRIRQGIAIAMDSPGNTPGVEKICCSFGSRDQWAEVLRTIGPRSTNVEMYYACQKFSWIVKNAQLHPGACGGDTMGDSSSYEGVWSCPARGTITIRQAAGAISGSFNGRPNEAWSRIRGGTFTGNINGRSATMRMINGDGTVTNTTVTLGFNGQSFSGRWDWWRGSRKLGSGTWGCNRVKGAIPPDGNRNACSWTAIPTRVLGQEARCECQCGGRIADDSRCGPRPRGCGN